MTRDSNLNLAMRYAEAGLSVFPCKADASRHPLVKWRANSTSDIDTITRWWKRWPQALVSIDLAKVGLVVIDADRHQGAADGVAAFAELMRQHVADLSSVPITQTPGNGFHLYFRQPKGEPLGNRSGDLPAGIDVKGRGGSITAPGNIRPDGKAYRGLAHHPALITAFKTSIIPIVPDWLIEIISPPARPTEPIVITHQSGKRFERYASATLARMANELAAKGPESGRNCALNRHAWRMGTMAARGWIGRAEIERVLFQAAAACRLVRDTGAHSVKTTIASGLKAGLKNPHRDLADRR